MRKVAFGVVVALLVLTVLAVPALAAPVSPKWKDWSVNFPDPADAAQIIATMGDGTIMAESIGPSPEAYVYLYTTTLKIANGQTLKWNTRTATAHLRPGQTLYITDLGYYGGPNYGYLYTDWYYENHGYNSDWRKIYPYRTMKSLVRWKSRYNGDNDIARVGVSGYAGYYRVPYLYRTLYIYSDVAPGESSRVEFSD
ncbi:MAG: hypothetical protein NT074_03120 [Methanomicrobiales archaeon]|nr:hypothetical protein [Methanomicrobiales archaeon]